MGYYARKNTCGYCGYFDYDGSDSKGYCKRIGAYYYPDEDCCSHYYEDDDRISSGSSGCFITTACCEHKGLADDCSLLQKLRRFRDTYIMSLSEGSEVIEEYYRIAPQIVSAINVRTDVNSIYDQIYHSLLAAADLIDNGCNQEAYELYKDMVASLKDTYLNTAKYEESRNIRDAQSVLLSR